MGQHVVHVPGDPGAFAFGGALLVHLAFAFEAGGAFGQRGSLGTGAGGGPAERVRGNGETRS
ncbi:hypothetical protein ACWCP6_19970 [Streptomyces sp. NPDC002004]